jgi:DNA-binding NarL/FixJ family response regulator
MQNSALPPATAASSQMSDDTKKISLILVDDHPGILRQAIDVLPERFEVLETLEDGMGLQSALTQFRPDILVLDVTLPFVSGVELARNMRAAGFTTKIVFLTVHADSDYAWEAFDAGALGYVVKPRLASDLVSALDAAAAGNRFVSPCAELSEFM